MAQKYNMINDISPLNENWKIKVRIIRLWETPNNKKADIIGSIDMVLVDEKVNTFCMFIIIYSVTLYN